jgi:hypothetical protein
MHPDVVQVSTAVLDGSFVVRKFSREWFEQLLAKMRDTIAMFDRVISEVAVQPITEDRLDTGAQSLQSGPSIGGN